MAAHRASGLIATPNALIGRPAELRRLREAVEKRESLLIHGPRGSGKTRIVRSVIESLPFDQRSGCIYIGSHSSVKDLARLIVAALYEAGDPIVRRKFASGDEASSEFPRVLRKLSSGQLKAAIYAATPKRDYWVFLDDFAPASRAMARFVKEMVWRCRTPVYAIARGCTRKEIGHAWSIYFAREYQLNVGPLAEAAARELLERNIRRWRVEAANLDAFRKEALDASGGLPGAIERICELAADSAYRAGREIKLKLLRMDWLMEAGGQARASGAA